MYAQAICSLLLCGILASAHQHHPHTNHKVINKRMSTPDNTCGGSNGYTCDPRLPQGGACCSAHGFCGNSADYCGTGCQAAFGTCGFSTSTLASSVVSASSVAPSPASNTAAPPASGGSSAQAVVSGCVWVVDGAASFTHHEVFDFTQMTSLPSGLVISTDPIPAGSAPYSQHYTADNIAVTGGTLQLKVPGGQTASPILGAELATVDKDILYGSVTTTVQISSVAGTTHGMFFYKNDNQESDIEILTADLSQGAHFTNQNLNPAGGPSSTATKPLPDDATITMHEYRLDWHEGSTYFYLDNKLQQTISENVPNTPGSWLWNNWSNGDKTWSAGPPVEDNIMKISKIEMYYNRTGSAGTCT